MPPIQVKPTSRGATNRTWLEWTCPWPGHKTNLSKSNGTTSARQNKWLRVSDDLQSLFPFDTHLNETDYAHCNDHLSSAAYFSQSALVIPVNHPLKNIVEFALVNSTVQKSTTLTSTTQKILQNLYQCLGNEPLSQDKLQYAPRWLLDEAVEKQKNSYAERKAYVSISICFLPLNSSLISSHHFFVFKHDRERKQLEMKCSLVTHGNKNKQKHDLGSDSSMKQFPTRILLLSLATLFHFTLAALDVEYTYRKTGKLNMGINMKPLRGWTKSVDEVSKLLDWAHGLVESGRLWQICVDNWLSAQGLLDVSVVSQFSLLWSRRKLTLILAKFVDDMIIPETPEAI